MYILDDLPPLFQIQQRDRELFVLDCFSLMDLLYTVAASDIHQHGHTERQGGAVFSRLVIGRSHQLMSSTAREPVQLSPEIKLNKIQ